MKPTILIIDDEALVRENLKTVFLMEGYDVILAENGEEGVNKFTDSEPDVVLLDVMMPDIGGKEVLERIRRIDNDAVVLIITGVPGFDDAVEFVKSGAYDYLPKPMNIDELKFHVERALESARLKKRIEGIEKQEIERYGFERIIGESKAVKDVCSLASKVAVSSTTPALITGESGTGKELLARAIHLSSPRRDKPFIIVNCTTLNEELLESDLFGHEKGAFTGAIRKKIGKFEMAQTGTIFLDEIGDLYPKLQMKLLRVLQEHEIERVGGTFPIKVDVRVISATNKDLAAMVKDSRFREDLYYRLNVVNIKLPSLKERGDDILLLSRMFVAEFGLEFNKKDVKLSPEAEKSLMSYKWRGNIRELRNVIERTVLLSNRNIITPEDFPEDIINIDSESVAEPSERKKPLMEVGDMVPLDKLEEMYIAAVLNKVGGNKSEAARILGITRQRLGRKIV